ncbi:GyrI-like domain-containing protein [Nitrosospira sp. Is2]|uniref:GyrI-like domain-containing protein n=1 Tax=Nitrosospira sp. Is2 TaxID=3080532 RepID=UPI00398761E7
MEPRLLSISSLTCAGLSEDIEMPRDKELIPSLWTRLQSRIPEISNSCGPAMGVVSRSGKLGCVRYAACIQVSSPKNVPDGLDIITVPGGDYAEFVHEGPVSDLFNTCDHIYRSWFPGSGLLPGDGPMVEVYPENFRSDVPNPQIRLLVSVKGRT